MTDANNVIQTYLLETLTETMSCTPCACVIGQNYGKMQYYMTLRQIYCLGLNLLSPLTVPAPPPQTTTKLLCNTWCHWKTAIMAKCHQQYHYDFVYIQF